MGSIIFYQNRKISINLFGHACFYFEKSLTKTKNSHSELTDRQTDRQTEIKRTHENILNEFLQRFGKQLRRRYQYSHGVILD